jgi:Family of unknown function (DUF5989)
MAGTQEAPRSEIEGREASSSRQRKLWWLLPLVVLFLLVGVIYVLGHMGSADSEMYPTTGRQVPMTDRLC